MVFSIRRTTENLFPIWITAIHPYCICAFRSSLSLFVYNSFGKVNIHSISSIPFGIRAKISLRELWADNVCCTENKTTCFALMLAALTSTGHTKSQMLLCFVCFSSHSLQSKSDMWISIFLLQTVVVSHSPIPSLSIPPSFCLFLLHVHKCRQQFIEVLICLSLDGFTPFSVRIHRFAGEAVCDKDTRQWFRRMECDRQKQRLQHMQDNELNALYRVRTFIFKRYLSK